MICLFYIKIYIIINKLIIYLNQFIIIIRFRFAPGFFVELITFSYDNIVSALNIKLVSSANIIGDISLGINNMGPRTEPWGTPIFIGNNDDIPTIIKNNLWFPIN